MEQPAAPDLPESEAETSSVSLPRAGRRGISTFQSLRFRDFRWFWLGAMASYLAMNMQMITRGWLILRIADDSPFALALAMVAFSAPMAVISPLGGALADRFSKTKMIIGSQTANVVMTLLLATLDFTGAIRFWHVMAIGVVNGSLVSISMPSRQALISDIVPKHMLMNAISLSNSGMNLARILGPALAGVLIVYLDTSGVFYLIAGFYALAALSMFSIGAVPEQVQRRAWDLFADIREGFVHAARNRTLSGLIIMLFVPALFGFPCIALLPAWGREALHVQSDSLGLLMMFMGVGSLLGSLILATLDKIQKRGNILLLVGLAWGLFIILFSQSASYIPAMCLLLMSGMMNAIFMSLNMTLLQTYADEALRGRVMSISLMVFGSMPLSVIPFGALAEKIGTPHSLSLTGLALIVFTIIFAIVRPQFRKIE